MKAIINVVLQFTLLPGLGEYFVFTQAMAFGFWVNNWVSFRVISWVKLWVDQESLHHFRGLSHTSNSKWLFYGTLTNLTNSLVASLAVFNSASSKLSHFTQTTSSLINSLTSHRWKNLLKSVTMAQIGIAGSPYPNSITQHKADSPRSVSR